MQFMSSLFFFSFIATAFASLVSQTETFVKPICAMPLGTNLTTIKPITDVVYTWQHNHLEVTFVGSQNQDDSSKYVSLVMDPRVYRVSFTSEIIGAATSNIWNACSQGTPTLDPTKIFEISLMTSRCASRAKSNGDSNTMLLGYEYSDNLIIAICYNLPSTP